MAAFRWAGADCNRRPAPLSAPPDIPIGGRPAHFQIVRKVQPMRYFIPFQEIVTFQRGDEHALAGNPAASRFGFHPAADPRNHPQVNVSGDAGILTITLPKAEVAKALKIAVTVS